MPAQIKCLLGFGIAKPVLTVEQWERMMLQGLDGTCRGGCRRG